jgi:hypothetical protein
VWRGAATSLGFDPSGCGFTTQTKARTQTNSK